MRIRRARPDDLPSLMEFFRQLDRLQAPWRVFPPRAGLSEEMEGRYVAILRDRDAILLMAEEGAGPIGMAAGHLHKPSSMSEDLAVELSSVFVLPSHRGRGVARALAAQVATFARARGAHRVTLKTFAQNEEALAAWDRMGFIPRTIQMTAPVDALVASVTPLRERLSVEVQER